MELTFWESFIARALGAHWILDALVCTVAFSSLLFLCKLHSGAIPIQKKAFKISRVTQSSFCSSTGGLCRLRWNLPFTPCSLIGFHFGSVISAGTGHTLKAVMTSNRVTGRILKKLGQKRPRVMRIAKPSHPWLYWELSLAPTSATSVFAVSACRYCDGTLWLVII